MNWRFGLRAALRAIVVAGLILMASSWAGADESLVAPGGRLDPAYPDAEIYLEVPGVPSIPEGAACRVAKRYVDLVNDQQYAELADLYSQDATFLEPVRPGLRGRAAIRDFYARRIGSFQPKVTPVAFVGNESECMMELAMEMPVDGRPRWILVSVDHFVLDDDGKVKLMVVFARPPTKAMRSLLEANE